MKSNFIFLNLIYLLSLSCWSQSSSLINSDKEIISMMIDKTSYPLPPPPPVGSNDTIMSQKVSDSLLSIKLKVAIYPVMDASVEETGQKNIPKPYLKLLNEGEKSAINISKLEGISSKKGHQVVLADTTELKKSKDFEDFDLLLHFSKIQYNKDFTKAIFELGVSRSQLWGGANVYCLYKIKGKWEVDTSFQTTIW